MSVTVCLAPANTVGYPEGGGHFWVYLNWALSLREAGARVIWLEGIDRNGADSSVESRRRWRGRDVRECVAEEAADTDGHVDAGAAEFVQGDRFERADAARRLVPHRTHAEQGQHLGDIVTGRAHRRGSRRCKERTFINR